MNKERTVTANNLPPGYRMTELGPLPEEWKVVRLGEMASIKQGKVLSTKNFTDYGYPVFGANGQIGWYSQYTHEEPEVLVTCRGATCGTVNMSLPKSFITNNAMIVKPKNDNLLKNFLYFALTSADLKRIITGSGQPQITKSALSTVSIPLPPLPEQRAIAYVLRSVQEAKEKTENVINALKELKKSLMKHLFTYGPVPVDEVDKVRLKETEIGRIPEHWKVVRLGEVVKLGHRSAEKSNVEFIPFIPMSFIPDDNLFIEQWEIRKLTEVRSGVLVQRGDLLLAKITPSLENGKQGILKNLPSEWGYATTEVFPIWTDKKDLLEIIFLAYYLKYPKIRNNLASKMEGTTGRRRLPKHVLTSLPIPLPPLPEQKQIAHILRSVDEKIEAERKRLEALDKVFKALLNDLMTARRRVPGEFVNKFASRMEDTV